MATEPAIDPLKRAHDDLVSAYARLDDGAFDGSPDLTAHLRIAQVLLDAADQGVAPGGDEALFESVPESPATRRRVAALESTLADRSISLDDDPLGRLYEATRSLDDRRTFGQFYTPKSVAMAAAEWALAGVDGAPAVLDPGAGSGTFLVAAAEALHRQDREPADARFVAVDVKQVPLALARLRLALEPVDRPRLRTINASFFDLDPGAEPPDGSVLFGDPRLAAGPIGPVDAVIGNPPFVRGEALEADPDHYRSHLATFGADAESPYRDGEAAISRRSDAYVYFITQATRFLEDGGRLALVLPTKWLMSGYGESLQRFLFDHYAVSAVIGLAEPFDDALVDTCLLLATRTADPDRRGDGRIRFVRRTGSTEPPLDNLVDPTATAGADTVTRPQGALAPGKLDQYLTAPEWLLDLEAHDGVVPLEAVASVSRGVMTGANRFFFVDAADRNRWDIDPALLRPAVKSLRQIEAPVHRADAVDRWLVDVHGYRSALDDASTVQAVKAALARDGYEGLGRYIHHAEGEGWHDGRTCQQRSVWFDLGPLPNPDAFVPKLLRERRFVIRNRSGATPSNAIDCVSAEDLVDPGTLVAVLNSSLVRAFMEIKGRNEAGMLQLMTYETASLPIPDPRAFDPDERDDLVGAFEAYVRDEPDARTRLDRLVHAAVGLDVDPGSARSAADRLRRRRLES